uniref:Zinc phosphodiesterase, putative n=1 Tax=Arundo donax TaxID=35708 RepID=A0A0A9D485_ARUDO
MNHFIKLIRLHRAPKLKFTILWPRLKTKGSCLSRVKLSFNFWQFTSIDYGSITRLQVSILEATNSIVVPWFDKHCRYSNYFIIKNNNGVLRL